jgi:multicomponent Na+:H+ antiporter subunit D
LTIHALPPLPVVVPFLAAALLMAVGHHLSRRVIDVLAITTAAAVAGLCALLLDQSRQGPIVYWFGGWKPRNGIALGISFVIDPFGAVLALLAALLVLAGFVYCWRYFNEVGPLYPALVLTFLGAMAGFALTGDLFNLFVFFELMSVAAYALTAVKIEEEESLMGAFSFAVSNSIGSFLVLLGIALLYGRTGALNLAQIGTTLHGQPADGLVVTAWVFIAAGFSVKAALVPFHFWLADAHAVAPAPVCVLFSGVMVELGLYAVLRVYWTVFAGTLTADENGLRLMLLAAGTLSAVLGGVLCFAQRHLKRMLAFSTISHMGMFVIGAGCLTADGLAGTGVYVLGHGFVKGGLFLCAGVVLNRFGSVDENRLRGRAGVLRGLGVLVAAGGLALSGMPPFGTCTGKALIEDAAEHLGHRWVSAVFLLCSALTGGAVLRAAAALFLGWGHAINKEAHTPQKEERETEDKYPRTPLVMLMPVGFLLILGLAVGLWPALVDEAQRAANDFQNPARYRSVVLYSQTPVRAAGAEEPPPRGYLMGGASALAAAALALLALFSDRLPSALCRLGRTAKPLLSALHAVHSGHVGDYVVWIVAGVAALGGFCALLAGKG